jgi:hypothetical protein
MKKIFVLAYVICICIFPWVRLEARAQEDAIFIHDTENGPLIICDEGFPNIHDEASVNDASVVWSNYLVDAIYLTTSNTGGDHVFAGTYLNPPKEAELFELTGGGIPLWIYSGNEFYTDAGDAAFTLGAVNEDALGINVVKWTGPGTGIPDWVDTFAGYVISSYGPVAMSDDGSTFAVIAAPSGTDAHLLLFDADSANLVDYTATGLGFPRYVKINADGRYTAFIALSTIVVYDRDSLSVRSQIPMGFTNSALDISGDGNLIAYGWPTMQVLEWNGTSYQTLWTWSPGGYYVSKIAISNDGSTIVSCWYPTVHNTIKVAVHNAGSSTPLWTYDYPTSSGVYQESAADIDITNSGSYFIIGSWGDANNINPEVHIFQRDTIPHTYYTVDMPGSVFSVDISNDGTYATACGKHIHANVSGRGGDIVQIATDIIGVSENTRAHTQSIIFNVHPNPFTKATSIILGKRFRAKGIEMKIYDISGKEVKSFLHITLDALHPNLLSWDGTDDLGRELPPGVYFVRLQVDEHLETEKLILIK